MSRRRIRGRAPPCRDRRADRLIAVVSVLGMIWLWRDTGDPDRLADHAQATLWYVLPSLPMFVLIPAMLRAGVRLLDQPGRRLPADFRPLPDDDAGAALARGS